jgi:hypothetical protein
MLMFQYQKNETWQDFAKIFHQKTEHIPEFCFYFSDNLGVLIKTATIEGIAFHFQICFELN